MSSLEIHCETATDTSVVLMSSKLPPDLNLYRVLSNTATDAVLEIAPLSAKVS